jgi:hypothetical protein
VIVVKNDLPANDLKAMPGAMISIELSPLLPTPLVYVEPTAERV